MGKVALVLIVTAYAYCPGPCCCGPYADGKTATGTDARLKGIAVDPAVIPLGSLVEVPGYGTVRADDTGGSKIKGLAIDVRFRTHAQAVAWGKRRWRVIIRERPKQ
jgi:3D (Asp-Asp-Asp) domain-containing protein